MFELRYKLKQHQKQITTLLKHVQKYSVSGLYLTVQMQDLEHRLLAHVYVVSQAAHTQQDNALLACLNNYSLTQLCAQPWQVLSSVLETHNQQLDEQSLQILTLLFNNLLVAEHANWKPQYNDYSGHDCALLCELLLSQHAHWQVQPNTSDVNAVIASPNNFNDSYKKWIFAHLVSDENLQSALQSEDFCLVYACALQILLRDHPLKSKLFSVFSNMGEANHKSQFLALVGIFGDPQWLESSLLFCQHHPEYCAQVLAHFQRKSALTIIIQLMSEAKTQTPAYNAWQLITNKTLKQRALLQAVNQPKQGKISTDKTQPCLDHAEHIRQQICTEPGTHILRGINFNPQQAPVQLNGLAGILAQRACATHFQLPTACMLFNQTIGAKKWQRLQTEALQNAQEGDHVA